MTASIFITFGLGYFFLCMNSKRPTCLYQTLWLLCFFLAAAASFFLWIKATLLSIPSFQTSFWTLLFPFHHTITLGIHLDPFNLPMVSLLLGLNLIVMIYSQAYFKEQQERLRFLKYLEGFVSCMLIFLVGDNFFQWLIGWEGMTVSSYFLIGFYHEKKEARQGALFSFLLNRWTDLLFLCGLGLLFLTTHQANYKEALACLPSLQGRSFLQQPLTEWIALLIWMGVMGKSAQFPFHKWMPHSITAPLPASSLLHAATMVTAGLFLLCRMAPLFEMAPLTSNLMALIGITGTLWFAVRALYEDDIKRLLIFATLSQLGWMVVLFVSLHANLVLHQILYHALFKTMLFLAFGQLIITYGKTELSALHFPIRQNKLLWIVLCVSCYAQASLPYAWSEPLKGLASSAFESSSIFGIYYLTYGLKLSSILTTFYSIRLLVRPLIQTSAALSPSSQKTDAAFSFSLILLILGFFLFHGICFKQSLLWHASTSPSLLPVLSTLIALLYFFYGRNIQWLQSFIQRFHFRFNADQEHVCFLSIETHFQRICGKSSTFVNHWIKSMETKLYHGVLLLGEGVRRLQTGELPFYFFLTFVFTIVSVGFVLWGNFF